MNTLKSPYISSDGSGRSAADAFEPMLDYAYAHHLKVEGAEQTPLPPALGMIGSFALLVTTYEKAGHMQERFDAWRAGIRERRGAKRQQRAERRKAQPAPVTAKAAAPAPAQPDWVALDASTPPKRVIGTENVYRSHFSHNQPDADVPLSTDERDEIMEAAVRRARAHLGEIPVAHEVYPPRRSTADDDTVVLERLEKDYSRPAQEPDRTGHVGRHRAPDQDEDRDHDGQLTAA